MDNGDAVNIVAAAADGSDVDILATAVILGTGNIVVAAPGNIAVGTAADVVGIVVTAAKI